MPSLRDESAAHPLCGQRDQLLPALPDRGEAARRSFAVALAEERLAEIDRRAGATASVSRERDEWSRIIVHADMDAFYAAIEQLDDPRLRGRPLLIGSDSPRSVVLTASYEARSSGAGSAMPMQRARRLCPEALVVPPRFARYQEISELVMNTLGTFSPLVEPLSLDEAFLDMTGARGCSAIRRRSVAAFSSRSRAHGRAHGFGGNLRDALRCEGCERLPQAGRPYDRSAARNARMAGAPAGVEPLGCRPEDFGTFARTRFRNDWATWRVQSRRTSIVRWARSAGDSLRWRTGSILGRSSARVARTASDRSARCTST